MMSNWALPSLRTIGAVAMSAVTLRQPFPGRHKIAWFGRRSTGQATAILARTGDRVGCHGGRDIVVTELAPDSQRLPMD